VLRGELTFISKGGFNHIQTTFAVNYKKMKRNYIALHIHLIWTTKNREPLLTTKVRYPLLEHIRKNAVIKGIKIRIINGVEDHLHCLVSLRPTQCVADVIKQIKGESSRWLNEQGWLNTHFEWQDGYGAIAVSPQLFGKVNQYIFNQETHHAFNILEDELRMFEGYSDESDFK
jgi:putative transposase